MQERDGRDRPVCTACGHITFLDPKLAVAALIVCDGQILLGKRGPGTRSPGRWSFPAGFVERGEQVEAAAAREVREETGLEIEPGHLIGLYSEAGETVVLAVYESTVRIPDAVPAAADDLIELGWFPLDALPELAFERDYRIIERLLAAGT
jgi:8-oxo-dGTP pyrophosphatase MutT (NUDIX family)